MGPKPKKETGIWEEDLGKTETEKGVIQPTAAWTTTTRKAQKYLPGAARALALGHILTPGLQESKVEMFKMPSLWCFVTAAVGKQCRN